MDEQLSIEDRIFKLLENIVLQGHKIENSSTWEDMGLDSLDKIETLMDIEDEFRVEIPDETMELIDNVEELIEFIRRIAK